MSAKSHEAVQSPDCVESIAPDRIVAGDVRFLAHVLVVPASDAAEQERHDARVEEPAPRLVRARDPFGKLLANRHSSAAYMISAGSLLEAGERT